MPPPPPEAQRLTLLQLLRIPEVRSIAASSFMLSFLGMGLEVVFILFSYTSIELGGLGRSVSFTHYVVFLVKLIWLHWFIEFISF